MLLLRHGPEDLPAAPRLFRDMILFDFFTGVVVMSTRFVASTSVFSTLVDLVLTLAFTYLLLVFINRRSRFVQTASALCGIGALFHLLFFPLLTIDKVVDISGHKVLWVLMLLVTSWELLVVAHIFRRAIESSMVSAIALSFALFIISITISQLLFQGVS